MIGLKAFLDCLKEDILKKSSNGLTCILVPHVLHPFKRVISSLNLNVLRLKTEREREDDCSLSDMPKQNLHWMGKSERGTYQMRVGTSHK